MQVYLPIADLPVNVFVVFAMGIAVGFISGMFGIGGGFLMTPLLIFLGISPAVAVATSHRKNSAPAYTMPAPLLFRLCGPCIPSCNGSWQDAGRIGHDDAE